ncbi:MAG: energy-coupled thiamine transporter ThiT [Anaeroplasmataceae bacterium]
MKNNKINIIAEIAICAAIGYTLELLCGSLSEFLPFANGGTISIALVVIFVIGYRRGFTAAIFCGLVIGLLDIIDGFYAVSDAWWKVMFQLGLDYLFVFAVAAFGVLLKPIYLKLNTKTKKALILSATVLIGGFLKFLCHFISGAIFWPQTPDASVAERLSYSFVYNISYMLPTIILTLIVFVFISIKHPTFINLSNTKRVISNENSNESENVTEGNSID